MITNIGAIERVIRGLIGLVIFWMVFYVPMADILMWTLVILGIFFIATGLSGYCMVYHLLKFSTSKNK